MDGHSIMPSVAGIVVLLICSAYFSATETAFTSLNRIRIKNKAESGDEQARRVLALERNYDSLLSTILIGNNLVNIASTALATALFIQLYGKYGPTVATVFTTVVVLIFGEITPKSLAKQYPEKFAMFSAPLIGALRIVLMPLNFLFAQWRKLLSVVFRTGSDKTITEDELVTIVDEAFVTGGIDENQSMLIQNAIGFSELEAQDVLTPRVDIEAIEEDDSIEQIDKVYRDTGFTRLPVYQDDLDGIFGVLNRKDFYNYIYHREHDVKPGEMVKPVIYVAETMKAAELLKKLQESKCRMAIVVDEYGGTTGLVTIEDIVEELVGEIYDETDDAPDRDIQLMQNGSYRVMGSANVEKVLDYFGEEAEINANTVNGWAAIELDKLPRRGDRFDYIAGNKRFHVIVSKADDRKALELNLRVEDISESKEGEKA